MAPEETTAAPKTKRCTPKENVAASIWANAAATELMRQAGDGVELHIAVKRVKLVSDLLKGGD